MENNIFLNRNGNPNKALTIKKYNLFIYNEIVEHNQRFENINWSCMVFNFINNITVRPVCDSCNHPTKFNTFKLGYKKYCSVKCGVNSTDFKTKRKKTLITKYGVENISQSEQIKEKKKNTLLKNYNVSSPLKSKIIKDRAIKTNIKHWGVKNVSESPIISERKKITTNINYGVDFNFQSSKIKKDINRTIKKKYDVDFYVQSNENKLKIKKSKILKMKEFWSNKLNISVSNIEINDNLFTINDYCKKHSSFNISRYNLYNRIITCGIEDVCTKCNPISEQSSIKENELKIFIETLDVNFIENDREILKGKEIDIYLPEHKLAIEFNGLYWHSDKFVNSEYHINKTELCEKQNIQLLHVFEDEWVFKKEIVKSIIKSKLGLINNRIYGRKTEILEITDNKLIRDFLNINHIQGFVGSNVKLGLFYENELLTIMTFGKKRISMGNKKNINGEYEMLRFCNKLNTTVIGGASKLLKYFIKNFQPKSILTFADRRYSKGYLYENLGFIFIGNTKPNYWYFKSGELKRYYRFNFRKDVLVRDGYDPNKTEYEIMNERGYLKIHDSGNNKFGLIL